MANKRLLYFDSDYSHSHISIHSNETQAGRLDYLSIGIMAVSDSIFLNGQLAPFFVLFFHLNLYTVWYVWYGAHSRRDSSIRGRIRLGRSERQFSLVRSFFIRLILLTNGSESNERTNVRALESRKQLKLCDTQIARSGVRVSIWAASGFRDLWFTS